MNCNKFSVQQRAFLAAITAAHEPAHFFEVVKDGKLREAMKLEIQELENNGIWVIEDLPPNKKALSCR